jgi:uncharacterized phiE125 gp8 family phage protein
MKPQRQKSKPKDVAYKITTAATSEPITRAEAKNWLKLGSDTTDDTLVDTLITAARVWVENHCAISLLPQTVLETWDVLPKDGTLTLSVAPLRSVSAVTYLDTAGVTQTMPVTVYDVDSVSMPARIVRAYGQTWPDTEESINRASAIYTVGYDNASAVPAPIKTAMLLTIADMYDNRTDYVKKMPTAAEYLLQAAGYRLFRFA